VGIAAHGFAAGENVALHGALNIFFCGTRLEIQLGVERIKLEVVAMSACGRAGPAITDFIEVIFALARTVGGLFGLWKILRKKTQGARSW
jgi:hypothetical protein